MASDQWFYNVAGGTKSGPVTTEFLSAMLVNGQLDLTTLVWREGLPNWVEAQTVRELLPLAVPAAATTTATTAPATMTPLVQGANQSVEYFRSSLMDMPPRAAATLRKCGAPRGDTSDWPLDSGRVGSFEATMKLRKKMKAAASLYQALLLLYIIGSVIGLFGAAFAAFSGPRGGRAIGAASFAGIAVVSIAFALLFHFARQATLRAKGWGSLTFFIIFTTLAVIYLGIGVISVVSTGEPFALLAVLFPIAFLSIFAVVSWKANRAIPHYLAQPAWCQELATLSGN